MKKIIIAVLIFAFTGSVNAQKNGKEKIKHNQRTHHEIRQQVNLSNDQQTRIRSINENFRKQMEELRKQDQLTVKEMNEKKHSLQKQHKQDIQAVLTAEQKEQLAKSKKEQKEKGLKSRKEKAGKISEEVDLTNDQRQKITQLRESYHAKAEALKNDNTLTKEQKRERLQELMKQQRAEMKTILTEEQIQKLQSRERKRPGKKVK
ncbi:MAG: hypothetical protein ABR502_06310 [Chitinophagaceae bacterium]